MNARSQGSGTETLVLAHGYGMDQSVWDKVVPLLVENYRVVTFDWACAVKNNEKLYDPVKYSSYEAFADDLITLLQEMDLKAVTFVGSSMSGIIGCIASLKTPQLFKTLILVGSSPRYLLSSLPLNSCCFLFTSSLYFYKLYQRLLFTFSYLQKVFILIIH